MIKQMTKNYEGTRGLFKEVKTDLYLTHHKRAVDRVADDLLLMYGWNGYQQFVKLCVDNTFNPLICLEDFYPAYYGILSTSFKEELWQEVQVRWGITPRPYIEPKLEQLPAWYNVKIKIKK